MSRLDAITAQIPALQPKEGQEAIFQVAREALVETMRTLKEDPALRFRGLLDLTAVEYPEEMVGIYVMMNLDDYQMITLEVPFPKEDLRLPSVVALFSAADVLECETYDFFGIQYEGHPNLRRVLCAEDFVGHPLRKDYTHRMR